MTIQSYENFADYKDKFDIDFRELKILNQILVKNKIKSDEISIQITRSEQTFDELREERGSYIDKKEVQVYEKDKYVNTYKRIQNHHFGFDEDLDMPTIEAYKLDVENVIDGFVFNLGDIDEFIKTVLSAKPKELINELNLIKSDKASYELKEKKQ